MISNYSSSILRNSRHFSRKTFKAKANPFAEFWESRGAKKKKKMSRGPKTSLDSFLVPIILMKLVRLIGTAHESPGRDDNCHPCVTALEATNENKYSRGVGNVANHLLIIIR